MKRRVSGTRINRFFLLIAKLIFGIYLMGNAFVHFFKKSHRLKFATFVLLLLLFFSLYYFRPPPQISEDTPSTLVKIPNGATFRQISDTLAQHGLLKNRRWFIFLGKLTGKEHRLRAGMFRIPRELNAWQLLNFLPRAKNVYIKVTLPEGILSFQIAKILAEKVGVDSARFVALVYDSSFAGSLGVQATSLEGFLLPETYFFSWKMPENEIIKYMVTNTLKIFKPDSVQQQLQSLKLSVREILTLASIIEGEVQVDSERVLVSSVYHNRLRKGWLLQADPTIQFIIPGPPRRLTYKDLALDSPYNTYKYTGLPPGPINNPGWRSILAALFPAKTSYLYFVATGDGGHRFSRTSREHAYWKRKFDEVRRRIRRQQKQKR